MIFRSNRPTYAIILLAVSSLWMCATFLPLLYSLVFPNKDIAGTVYALEERGSAPPEAVAVVQETIAAVGPLTLAVPVAYYSGVTAAVGAGGSSQTSKKQASYVARFQKHPDSLLLMISVYEDARGRKAYQVQQGEPTFMVRGYALPILLFGASLFLVRKR